MAAPGSERTILHLDMDAFFASVELLRHPELQGRPVVVGGDGPRGVVAAASYEARAYGVFSAMPSVRARRLCPDAVFLHGDHAHYSQVSARIMATLREVTPLVEPLSLDEAFCDVAGVLHGDDVVAELAHRLRNRIHAEEGLWCAVGVGPSKFVAKLASKAAKPRIGRPGGSPSAGTGVRVVRATEQIAFLHPMPVHAMWGVGPATRRRLDALGVGTIGELSAVPRTVLEHRLGRATGSQLFLLANGIDERAVLPDRAPKSIGHEETYSVDITSVSIAHTELLRLADATATRLRDHALMCRTVVLKVRFADFSTITRSATLPRPTASGRALAAEARRLFDALERPSGVRLLGVSAMNLGAVPAQRQLTFDEVIDDSWQATEQTVGAIRERFGPDAIAPAALVNDGSLDVRRRGDQQWGKPLEKP